MHYTKYSALFLIKLFVMSSIGLGIKKLLDEGNLSIKELSSRINKSTRSIYNYIEGKTVIDTETLQKIADVYKIPITSFFEDEDLRFSRLKHEIEFLHFKLDELYELNHLQKLKIDIYHKGIKSVVDALNELNAPEKKIKYFTLYLKVKDFKDEVSLHFHGVSLIMAEKERI